MTINAIPDERTVPNRAQEQACDKRNIRHQRQMRRDSSPQMLHVPRYLAPPLHDTFDVAQEPPVIDFAIVQLTPEYLDEGDDETAVYGGWGPNVRGPDDGCYFAIGNHQGNGGANAFLLRYDPQRKIHETVLNSRDVCGWSGNDFGDGKLHGSPDIAPNGELWLLTFYGPYPQPADWGGSYPGGRLLHANILTGEREFLGSPVSDESWPIHAWDWQRERLYAVGECGLYEHDKFGDNWPGAGPWDYGQFLVYNTAAREVIHAAVPEVVTNGQRERLHWFRRGLLLDRETGRVYGSESTPPHRIARYDPETNAFCWLQSRLAAPLHHWQNQKTRDGAFWCFDQDGGFYKFWPDADRVESHGANWGSGEYVVNLCLSPGERFVYYAVATDISSARHGMPIVQYDTRTRRKKVLAFLVDFYLATYGYGISNAYGLSISKDGGSLFLHVNGQFCAARDEIGYGRPALLEIHIPESERRE